MRQAADLSRALVQKRRKKELKRKEKRNKMMKVSGKGLATAGSLRPTWSGLKPRKIEGFLLYLRGMAITAKNWPYPHLKYGERVRMV